MKNNKRKHLEWSQEAGSGSSHALAYFNDYRPNKKRGILHVDTTLLSQQEEEGFFLPRQWPSQWETVNSSTNEKPLYLELSAYSSGIFVYNSPSQLPLSSIKGCSSPLFSGLAYGLALVCFSYIVILCSSQIN